MASRKYNRNKSSIKIRRYIKNFIRRYSKYLAKNKPALVLDRLHTFAVKYLRDLCEKYGIATEDPNGKKIALHGLAGENKKPQPCKTVAGKGFRQEQFQPCN